MHMLQIEGVDAGASSSVANIRPLGLVETRGFFQPGSGLIKNEYPFGGNLHYG